LIDIEGAIVTTDDMGCQTATADGIIERKADYVLAVKDNQPTPHTEFRQAFVQAASGFKPAFTVHVERRRYGSAPKNALLSTAPTERIFDIRSVAGREKHRHGHP